MPIGYIPTDLLRSRVHVAYCFITTGFCHGIQTALNQTLVFFPGGEIYIPPRALELLFFNSNNSAGKFEIIEMQKTNVE